MKSFSYSFLLSLLIFILSACNTKTDFSLIQNMDLSVNPGDNFYQYANGKWLKETKLPDNRTFFSASTELSLKNQRKLLNLIQNLNKSNLADENSIEWKINQVYNMGMDTVSINKLGSNPALVYLQYINSAQSVYNIQSIIADMHILGYNPLFSFFSRQDERNSSMIQANIEQGGLGLPSRSFYLSENYKPIQEQYIEYIRELFILTGVSESNAQTIANQVYQFETELAQYAEPFLDVINPQKSYHKYSITDLQEFAPQIDWLTFFQRVGWENPDSVNLRQDQYVKNALTLLDKYPIEAWKSYLKWNFLNNSVEYLDTKFEQTHFNFYGKTLRGQNEQTERANKMVDLLNFIMGEAVGQLYVQKYFPEEAKIKMNEMVSNLKTAFANRIDNLDWMSNETKIKAKDKLNTMVVKIGYPDKWRDYSGLQISSENFFKNMMSIQKFNFKYDISKIGKPYNKYEWLLPPQVVNAYYNPNGNEMVFPAAILQPPFFDMNANNDAVNYGAIGFIISHEMTHGFDNNGRKFDKNGNMNNWWTEEDEKAFNQNSKEIIDAYSVFKVNDSTFVNGELTLSENIADFGGLRIAYDAFKLTKKGKSNKVIKGFSADQRFLIAYATISRQLMTDKELSMRLKGNVHSPGIARVNVNVSHFDPFYKAFEISDTNKLYIESDKRVSIW